MSATVDVFVDHAGVPHLAGRAFFTRGRTGVSTTFTYDATYLAGGGTNIDPSLALTAGAQHHHGLLPAFADSAPDRWGRNLITRAERASAREEGRRERDLDDVDFLLGVSDESRQGALRFRVQGASHFASDHGTVPAMISLPRLLSAANSVAADDDPSDAVKELLDAGTGGLGGARPKAAVRLRDGALAIAKFPHSSDQWNVMAWECTALDLLAQAGIDVPERQLVQVGNSSVLVLKRFDRAPTTGDRIGYISAMTVAGGQDGGDADYADIAIAMRDLSADLPRDHRALFDRVAASVALRNTDDHLRNHGFLARQNQWALSPAFDVNPNPESKKRSTSIAGADRTEDEVDGLLALAAECGLSDNEARARVAQIASSMRAWQVKARSNDIPAREIAMMEAAIAPRLDVLEHVGAGGRRSR